MIWDWTNGWLWITAALALALIELLLPGYIFLGTALALAVTGVLLLFGFSGLGLFGTLIAAAVLSFLCWAVLRRLMGVQKGQVRIWDRDIND